MYPIRFEPIYQKAVWGGDRIASKYNRQVKDPHIAESWEISDRDDAMSIVMNGPLKGKKIRQLVQEMKEDLLGVGQKWERFPLLLKLIDAKENLSVQVHPDELTCANLGGEPKTETWVILEEGAVYAGLKKGVTEDELRKAIKSNKVEELIEKIDVKKGDAVFIPGGRVHAICGGTLLYEVQQNSNTTYRLYDWGRTGRELHLKEGFAAIHWHDLGHAKLEPRKLSSDLKHQLITLIASPFFVIDRIDIFNTFHVPVIPKSFQIFFCMEGGGHIIVDSNKEPFEPGMTYLVPAAAKSINFEGKSQVLRVRMP